MKPHTQPSIHPPLLLKKILSIALSVLSLMFILSSCGPEKKETHKNTLVLPVIGERQLSSNGTDTTYHRIGCFAFVNQFGDTITEQKTDGKIYVADFFFATCQSICPVMSTRMEMVQDAFKDDTDFLILSHTVNPEHDSVAVLAEYGKRYGAIRNKWHLLTGEKKKIYQLAKESYIVNAFQDDGTPEGFLHSELFLLIDKQRRIRGTYDGTDSSQVIKLIDDIKLLKTEK
jgi:protein SCO1/2